MMNRIAIVALLTCTCFTQVAAEQHILIKRLHHLRIGGPREWSDFPKQPDSAFLETTFKAEKNKTEMTLRLRQQDIKQTWNITVNGKALGRLHRDENDMIVYYPIAPGMLVQGANTLRIEQQKRGRSSPDDIRVGEIVLDSRPVKEVLNESTVEITVLARAGLRTPARITVIHSNGALQSVGAKSNDHLAVRPGVVYTSNGTARFGLPNGEYIIYAGRGFEYSLAKTAVSASTAATAKRTLTIRREVRTHGYVACDTHVHSLTHSGHGDATVFERMITIAAEGIELPIATDHNVHIEHQNYAHHMKVRRYFTPVIGNEVTTPVGHFNIWPVFKAAEPPPFKLRDWNKIFDGIYRTPDVKVCILNHARDIHGGTRPFGPKLFNSLTAENLEGWNLRANGMEVVNSGATQTDIMQLFRDWMAHLNRGRFLTPVGSSDSHDVARHFVGQGRTYIRCDDREPSEIDIDEAVNNFIQGRVMVSYGLLADLTVSGRYRSGEIAPVVGDKVFLSARVLGPHWVKADRIMLFANGKKIKETALKSKPNNRGVKWVGGWTIPRPKHDVFLTAIAIGPGVDGLYWPTAKAYQPTSPVWKAHVIGCSGAVWLDVDGDGRRTSAYDYAQRLIAKHGTKLPALIGALKNYDEAVAAHVASAYQKTGKSLFAKDVDEALEAASANTRNGFHAYRAAWRKSQVARAK